MTDIATLNQRLAEAEDALHQLRIGRRSVKITADGYEVVYDHASIPDLVAYVAQLQAEIDGGPTRGAIIPIF